MPPTQPRETAEVSVRRDPLATRFDRQRSKVRIRDEVASCASIAAEAIEDLPVTFTRHHDHGVRLGPQRCDERERINNGCRRRKDPRVRCDAHEPTEHEFGETKRLVGDHSCFEPLSISLVIRRAFMEGIDEHIDVKEDQAWASSMRSSRPAPSSRSTPGRSWLPANVGSFNFGLERSRRWRASDARRASSTTELSVLPERAAISFASARSWSSMVMVVRMHQSVLRSHQDVNLRRRRADDLAAYNRGWASPDSLAGSHPVSHVVGLRARMAPSMGSQRGAPSAN